MSPDELAIQAVAEIDRGLKIADAELSATRVPLEILDKALPQVVASLQRTRELAESLLDLAPPSSPRLVHWDDCELIHARCLAQKVLATAEGGSADANQ